jgi:hypothetical protein
VYVTWRDRFRPRIAAALASVDEAHAAGTVVGDLEKARRRAVRCPYKGGWLAQVWYDECAKQLGSSKGRIRSRSPGKKTQRALERSGKQGSLFDE